MEPEPETVTISQGAIDTLENIATSGLNLAAVFAKSMLESLGKDITYNELPNICDCMPGFSHESEENKTQIEKPIQTKPELIIHPNPANDRIEIVIINSSSGIHEIIIYDVYGKIVLQKNINAKDFLLLDITELSKGFYFITYELDDKQIIIKKLSKV